MATTAAINMLQALLFNQHVRQVVKGCTVYDAAFIYLQGKKNIQTKNGIFMNH